MAWAVGSTRERRCLRPAPLVDGWASSLRDFFRARFIERAVESIALAIEVSFGSPPSASSDSDDSERVRSRLLLACCSSFLRALRVSAAASEADDAFDRRMSEFGWEDVDGWGDA